MRMPRKAQYFIWLMTAAGMAVFGLSLRHAHSDDVPRYVAYLVISLLASGMKVKLPGVDGTMTVNFFFVILAAVELSLPEAMLLACSSTLVQCYWKAKRRPDATKVLFNVFGNSAPAIFLACSTFHYLDGVMHHTMPLRIICAASIYFLANTVPIAFVIALTEEKTFRQVWSECYFWSFPSYIMGAVLIAIVNVIERYIGWQMSLLIVPAIYFIYRSYRLYLGRLEAEKKYAEEVAVLHLRTIEALALAIDAKDHTTHDHLQRARIYALEIGKAMKLSADEMKALEAASVLHDIGKLAVPEHIINKPGRLTPEEFEKMKIHPAVGADILSRVDFPYPVVPIVRAHHEKWDGTGYPDGLKGEEIPIGARILSAVDCLDAMASDRQYRRALPLDQAMEHVAGLAGKDFDPKIIEILQKRYIELEEMAHVTPRPVQEKLLAQTPVERGDAPGAGFEQVSQANAIDFLSSIGAARQEAQSLYEITQELGNSLCLEDTFSLLSLRLKKLVPYDCIAIFTLNAEDVLIPQFVNGDESRLFSSLKIPLGQGLSGYVAQNHKPVINGNPSVEPGYLNDPTKFSNLSSALSVPLEGLDRATGVITLYRAPKNAFSNEDLRILLAVSSKIAFSIANAVKYEQAENSATTDFLTGLSNARSLFVHLHGEIARCKRSNNGLAVIVCDLDGFKGVNDRLGHLVGDRLLKEFASLLQKAFREYDCVARSGGDEFVIVAAGLTKESIHEKINSLDELARNAGLAACGDASLSVSLGTAFYGEDGNEAEQLLAEADRRMYSAKKLHYETIAVHGLQASSASAAQKS